MKLYYSPGACSLASHIALIEGGDDYAKTKVDLKSHTTEEGKDFYAISPRGYVPAIETEYGLMTENPAVLTYIAERTGALPDGAEYYDLLEWIGFIGTELHKNFGPLFAGDSDDRKARARAMLAEKYRLAERLIGGADWLVGDSPTVADNYLLVTLLWADKFGIDLPQSLKELRARNLDRDAVKQAMREEGLG